MRLAEPDHSEVIAELVVMLVSHLEVLPWLVQRGITSSLKPWKPTENLATSREGFEHHPPKAFDMFACLGRLILMMLTCFAS